MNERIDKTQGVAMKETKTIRQAVFDDEFVRELTGTLLKAPDRLHEAKQAITEIEVKLRYDTGVKDARQAVTDLEVECAFEVFNDLDDNGKKKFSNEDKRKTETRRRLLSDPDYTTMYVEGLNVIKDALQAEAAMKMDLGKACASFAALEAESHNLRSVAAMIAGLAHESTTQERIHRHVTSFETTVKLGENHV